ncbi:hypothetical protein BJX66DRAFT_292567 [Aspergillus keveii]|uniref:Uncharacterized protein n=1 Tax=Aspergillus keveii TaxID=714993 RepID=A0ABR4GL12_9EURO
MDSVVSSPCTPIRYCPSSYAWTIPILTSPSPTGNVTVVPAGNVIILAVVLFRFGSGEFLDGEIRAEIFFKVGR